MGPDNPDDRRRESNDYLDRQRDQSDFEKCPKDKSDAVYKSFIDHDPSRAEWELGIVREDPSDLEAERRAIADAAHKRNSTFWKLAKANALLKNAFQAHSGFSDVLAEVNDVLEAEPRNSEALTLRAVANSQMDAFRDAVHDADKALAITPFDASAWGLWMRQHLPAWRESAARM
jgi:tetratricopeptide (TPR) repeat protein